MTDNVTITPIYEQSHIITFEPNNGEQTTDTSINDGQAIGTFPTVVRETCTGTEGDYVERGCSEVFILDGWYLESDFQTKIDETYIPSSDITVYAKWNKVYSTYNQLVFDGTNYIDTGVRLFTEETIDKDFDISFEIVSRDTYGYQETIMNALDETGKPWPGVLYRIRNNVYDQISANVNDSNKLEKDYKNDTIQKVTFKRRSGILYVNFNDGTDELFLDMTSLNQTFDVPVTFGASLNGSGNPQRFFKGKLKNMNIKIYD